MTASAGSAASGARRSGSRRPRSRTARRSRARCWRARRRWVPGPGWPATGWRWYSCRRLPRKRWPARGPGTCVTSSCVAPLLRSCQRTSMPVTAAGIPPAVRGRGVSRAITSSRCTGGRLEEGPALVWLPGRHLPSLDRRRPGPSRHRSGGRAREDHGSPSAGVGVRGQEMDDIGWQRLAGELGSGPELVEGAQDGSEERARRRPPRRRRGRRGATS